METLKIKTMFEIYYKQKDLTTLILHDKVTPEICSFQLLDKELNVIYESPHVFKNEDVAFKVIEDIIKMSLDTVKLMSN